MIICGSPGKEKYCASNKALLCLLTSSLLYISLFTVSMALLVGSCTVLKVVNGWMSNFYVYFKNEKKLHETIMFEFEAKYWTVSSLLWTK